MLIPATSLQQLAETAGIATQVTTWLEKRGFGNPGLLAASADSFQDVDELHWEPWKNGTKIGEEEWLLEDADRYVFKAALRHLWTMSRKLHVNQEAPNRTANKGPELPDEWANSSFSKEPKQADSTKKDEAAEAMQQLVDQYEAVQIDGRNRRFPMKLLLGSEKVLHRVWTEHSKTGQYTPLMLHEIMEARCFDSCGQLNSLSPQFRTKAPHTKLTVDKESNSLIGVQLLDGRRRTEPEPEGDLESDRLPDGDQTMLDAHQVGPRV